MERIRIKKMIRKCRKTEDVNDEGEKEGCKGII